MNETSGIPQRVLIACIGNIFYGDDAFGCEVARRLAERTPTPGVRLVDFGIRAFDLAYAMLDDWELVILVDATERGAAPGTLFVIEPDLAALDNDPAPIAVEAHSMHLEQVLRMAKAMGGALPESSSMNRRGLAHFAMPCEQNVPDPLYPNGSQIRAKLLLVGCQPADLGDAEAGKLGLSPAVAAAVDEAALLIDSLLVRHFAADAKSAAELNPPAALSGADRRNS